MTIGLHGADVVYFLLGEEFGVNGIDANLAGKVGGGVAVIAGEEGGGDAHLVKGENHIRGVGAEGVAEGDDALKGAIVGNADGNLTLATEGIKDFG